MNSTKIAAHEALRLQRVAANGDARAFAELVNQYQNLAYSAAIRILGNQADAEDVTQEAFLCLYEKASGITSSIGGWLHRCATGLAMNLVRSRSRRTRREMHAAELETLQRTSAWESIAPDVDVALDSLPEDLRQLMIAYFLERRSQSDLAESMGVSIATVSRKIDDGVQQLRRKLGQSGLAVETAMLSSFLADHAVVQAPSTLTIALGKIAMAGFKSVTTAKPVIAGGSAMKVAVVAILSAAAIGTGTIIVHQKPRSVPAPGRLMTTGNDTAKAGSSEFYPSAERPTGWRGDWTGRFPGATPPTNWYRLAKTPLKDMRCQAEKPKDGGPGNAPILGCSDGRLFDWLIMGPVQVDNPDEAIEQETIKGEAGFSPDAGEKVNDLVWEKERIKDFGGGLNMCLAGIEFPDNMTSHIAYAHTYVYCGKETELKMYLGHAAGGLKIWMNGNPVYSAKTPPAQNFNLKFAQGWNRLLIKASKNIAYKPGAHWRYSSNYQRPDKWIVNLHLGILTAPETLEYETKNIKWMTRLVCPWGTPNPSTPVVVDDRIFLTCQPSDLVCLDRHTGKILWLRTNNFFDGASEEEKRSNPLIREKVEPLAAKLAVLNERLVTQLNDAAAKCGVSRGHEDLVSATLRERSAVQEEIYKLMCTVDARKYSRPYVHWFWAVQTPVSDGKYIYAWFSKIGAACYDLDGNRRWFTITEYRNPSGHHGEAGSPVLVDGKFICLDKHLLAYDASSGKLAWHSKLTDSEYIAPSLITARIGGESVVIVKDAPNGMAFRVKDGSALFALARTGGWVTGVSTPVIENGRMFFDAVNTFEYWAADLPEKLSEEIKILPAKKIEAQKGDAIPGDIASPLCCEGLVYMLGGFGMLRVYDAKTLELVYRKYLDEMRLRENGARYQPGVCASPALAGKHIYLFDNSGIGLILQPAREYKQVARNILEQFGRPNSWDSSAWVVSQEQVVASPVFVGKDIYLRGCDYLYCITQR